MFKICEDISERVLKRISHFINSPEGEEYVQIKDTKTQRIDVEAEKACLDVLKNLDVMVLSEESGLVKFGSENPEYICILDPLDGSFNALHRIPFFAVSIAFIDKHGFFSGYVKNLVNGDTFYAERGKDATLNGLKITTSKKKNLEKSVFSVYLKRGIPSNILQKALTTRTLGSAALEMCYVACGIFEGYIDLRGTIRNVDIAASSFILRKAGGTITDEKGREIEIEPYEIKRMKIVATCNSELHKEVLKYL